MKRNIPDMFVGALLAVAIFAMGFLATSAWSPQPNDNSQTTPNQEANQTKPDKSFWERATDDPVAYFSLWITIFTGISVLSNIGLWLVTRSTLLHSRQTDERQLRAYLTVVEGAAIRQTRALRFQFNPVILNTGQTPAYGVHIVSGMKLLTPEEAETYNFSIPSPNQVLVSNTIGAQQNKFIGVVVENRLSMTELREFRRGIRQLFVFGTVHYRDAFGNRRFTNFCFSVAAWNKRFAPLWHMTNRHNDSN